MKIHRWSPWLRRHHTWAPSLLFHVELGFHSCLWGVVLWGVWDLAHRL